VQARHEDAALVSSLLDAGTGRSTPRAKRSRAAVKLTAEGLFPFVGAPLDELVAFLDSKGVTSGHATALFTAVHRDGVSPGEAVASLPPRPASIVSGACDLRELEAVHDEVSEEDGTRKWLFRLPSDGAEVETVFIPEADGRGVLCVSSSVGCALSCKFCHTGTQKLLRNLTVGEIVGQLQSARRLLDRFPGPTPGRTQGGVSNVVFMGQGEPLLNWRSVRAAVGVMTHSRGGAVPPRRVTVSTSGVAPAMPLVASEAGCSLALSLHGTTDETRSRVIPLNRTWGLDAVMEGLRRYTLAPSPRPPSRRQLRQERDREETADEDAAGPASPPPPSGTEVGRRMVMFEYVMLEGVNDSQEDAERLAALAAPFKCHVNLIPFNQWPGSGFRSTPDDEVRRFGETVLSRGVSCTVRWPKGRDIMAACGQLHSEKNAADRV